MQYLLDSDVIIDFLKSKDPGYALVTNVIEEELSISVVTWMEISYGAKKADRTGRRLQEFKDFLGASNIRIIPIDQDIGGQFIEDKLSLEKRGERLADFDLFIASTAKVHKRMLVTRNTKHFGRIAGLKLFER